MLESIKEVTPDHAIKPFLLAQPHYAYWSYQQASR
jgi:hypothetical protein